MADFPFDVVTFDLDGTLADTAPDLAAALNHTLSALGRLGVDPESVRHLVGHGAKALLRKALGGDEAAVERACRSTSISTPPIFASVHGAIPRSSGRWTRSPPAA